MLMCNLFCGVSFSAECLGTQTISHRHCVPAASSARWIFMNVAPSPARKLNVPLDVCWISHACVTMTGTDWYRQLWKRSGRLMQNSWKRFQFDHKQESCKLFWIHAYNLKERNRPHATYSFTCFFHPIIIMPNSVHDAYNVWELVFFIYQDGFVQLPTKIKGNNDIKFMFISDLWWISNGHAKHCSAGSVLKTKRDGKNKKATLTRQS